jgi:MoxR-like ATPase
MSAQDAATSFAIAADAEAVTRLLSKEYLADDRTALVLWLAEKLDRPVLIEGPPGVGKTDLARAAAAVTGRELLRLQCYEGLDEAKALYEWDYGKQMLYTQLLREVVQQATAGASSLREGVARISAQESALYTEQFLLPRPLLKAILAPVSVVLLVDEVDRAEPEFEALLLEILAERQVTIPELGTLRSRARPLVILTTNGSRDMSDALRRRCLHLFLDYPSPSRETAIVELRLPGIAHTLADALARFVAKLRKLDLRKAPSLSETLDWGRALLLLGASSLDRTVVAETLGLLLKYEEDREKAEEKLDVLLSD